MEENLIIDNKKDNSKVYKCTEYKKINKCKSFIILNDKKEILKYNSSHNHPENEYDVSLSIMKHKIKDGIEKSSIPFGIVTNLKMLRFGDRIIINIEINTKIKKN
ncbi:hypothetical protein H8356DRAFT_920818 [Neocallimastix lanati (nom. inval.)]|nr:hypothetical protein H8356DRAFT_920818 [Neocallimastix sp. JGI-2020a]